MNIVIPKRFDLGCRTWRVLLLDEFNMTFEMDKRDYENCEFAHKGMCDPHDAVIFINREGHTSGADLVHTFWHECGHAMLFSQGAFKARQHNETIVDRFGGLMAQLWITAKGDQI